MRERWGTKVSQSEVFTPSLVRSTALRSSRGVSLLLAELVVALVLAIKALTQPSQYRYALILGRSHTRLGLRLLRDNLLSATRWVLVPLAFLCLAISYDAYASALLSVRTITLELMTWSVALTVAAVLLGTLTDWVALVIKGQRRSGGEARPSHALALLAYVIALIMVWSFSTASSDLVSSVLEQQTLHSQAKAQDSLPHAISLSIWSVSESTFTELAPQVEAFVKDQEENGDLFLVWAIADSYTSDASGPPTLYLNNAAATHYSLPTVSPNEVALYLPADLAPQEALLTQRILDDAEFQGQTDASTGEDISITVHDQAEATSALPASLPAVSYFFSSQGTQTSDCLIEVVPDGYFAPTNYLSAVTQGAAVFTDPTLASLRQDLHDHHLEDLVAHLDTIGDGRTGTVALTTKTMVLHLLILLAAAAGAVASTSLSVRAWAQAAGCHPRRAHRRGGRRAHLVGHRKA